MTFLRVNGTQSRHLLQHHREHHLRTLPLSLAGYNEGEPYGEVYLIEIPNSPTPVQHHPSPSFGITWGGQREIVDRLVRGYDERVVPDNSTSALLKSKPVTTITW